MLGICNGRFSASSETQSKSFRGGARSYFRLISVQPMKQRWFRGLTISNQRTEMTRSYNISRQSDVARLLHGADATRRSAFVRRFWPSQTDMRYLESVSHMVNYSVTLRAGSTNYFGTLCTYCLFSR